MPIATFVSLIPVCTSNSATLTARYPLGPAPLVRASPTWCSKSSFPLPLTASATAAVVLVVSFSNFTDMASVWYATVAGGRKECFGGEVARYGWIWGDGGMSSVCCRPSPALLGWVLSQLILAPTPTLARSGDGDSGSQRDTRPRSLVVSIRSRFSLLQMEILELWRSKLPATTWKLMRTSASDTAFLSALLQR